MRSPQWGGPYLREHPVIKPICNGETSPELKYETMFVKPGKKGMWLWPRLTPAALLRGVRNVPSHTTSSLVHNFDMELSIFRRHSHLTDNIEIRLGEGWKVNGEDYSHRDDILRHSFIFCAYCNRMIASNGTFDCIRIHVWLYQNNVRNVVTGSIDRISLISLDLTTKISKTRDIRSS